MFSISDSIQQLPQLFLVSKLSRSTRKAKSYELSGDEVPKSTLRLVEIRFDTATFDDIERDKKIKTEAQLSLIGGTMGLLTGFSIISGVEIIFFLFRLVQNINDADPLMTPTL